MDANSLWAMIARLRERQPLVQCITNFVAMDVTANVLLAAGASPAMVHAAEEAGEFAALGGGLSINIGTPSPAWVAGMQAAVAAATARQTPWVLDPVAVGATAYRRQIVADLLVARPSVIRGNAGEISALADGNADGSKGVDSQLGSLMAFDAAKSLAARTGAVVALTGSVDYITDGTRLAAFANGDPLMTRVTALGCALSALVGAFLMIEPDAWQATAAAVAFYGVAGELAAEGTAGPASFRTRFIDILATLEPEVFAVRLKPVS